MKDQLQDRLRDKQTSDSRGIDSKSSQVGYCTLEGIIRPYKIGMRGVIPILLDAEGESSIRYNIPMI